MVSTTWITIVILELIYSTNPQFLKGMHLLDNRLIQVFLIAMIIHIITWWLHYHHANNVSFKFLPYQFLMVMVVKWWRIMIWFQREAWEMTTTSKEDNMCANYYMKGLKGRYGHLKVGSHWSDHGTALHGEVGSKLGKHNVKCQATYSTIWASDGVEGSLFQLGSLPIAPMISCFTMSPHHLWS